MPPSPTSPLLFAHAADLDVPTSFFARSSQVNSACTSSDSSSAAVTARIVSSGQRAAPGARGLMLECTSADGAARGTSGDGSRKSVAAVCANGGSEAMDRRAAEVACSRLGCSKSRIDSSFGASSALSERVE
jgi:hypothetical protein